MTIENFPNHELDVAELAMALEQMTRFMIRLPSVDKMSFTSLSVLHTLTLKSPLRLTELAATEQVTQSAITQLVTRLERDGLAERRADPKDGRVVQVHITPEGAKVIESRRDERIAGLGRYVDGLSLEQQQSIAAAIPALQRLAELGNGKQP